MANVFDVASYILQKQGEMTTMKLQKLVYYCQAWSLVWEKEPLFEEEIQAWANGPVVPDLYKRHKGQYRISSLSSGDASTLSQEQSDTVNAVLEGYGEKSGELLSKLTHIETPWRETRDGLAPMESSNKVIPLDLMDDYYSAMLSDYCSERRIANQFAREASQIPEVIEIRYVTKDKVIYFFVAVDLVSLQLTERLNEIVLKLESENPNWMFDIKSLEPSTESQYDSDQLNLVFRR